ncbi:MAG TPA: nucleoside recognition domain-containing protein, partial [Planctomycetota bacterium]|nr:nucleoside recognition domain-containing protein [Planctomycetota bacterium]
TYVFEPAFDHLWLPVMSRLSALLGGEGLLHDILIGRLTVDGRVDFGQSFGLLTSGLHIPFAAVLPYIFAFYLALSLLEDIGYLPRLGVVVDNVMHRVGLHGLSIVPMMLGLGCNVPGALASRVLETRKERFIASTLLAVCVPCMAQIAMVAGLLGRYGAAGLVPVFGTLLVLWIVLGLLMKRFTKGETPEILVDIPPYRVPYWKSLLKKLWMRVRWFIREAVPYVLLGVLVVNLLYVTGIIGLAARVFGPVMTKVLGLPPEAVGALLVGFLRKDVAVGMLAPLGLSLRQLIVASVVLTVYFPCVATFVVLFRELGLKDMLKSACIMVVTAFTVGGLLNAVLRAFGL